MITGATGLVNLTNIQVLDDSSSTQGGTINMANWPIAPLNTSFALPNGGSAPAGFQLLQLLNSDSDTFTSMTSDLVIQNGYVNFAINMQDINYNGHNFTITAGPVINVADKLDVWVGDFH